jgi:small subunit ribosomal protein S17e
VDRIKRLSNQVLEKYHDKFTTDFAENKKTLTQLAVVRSKGLKNEIAGYITKHIRREADLKAATEAQNTEEIQEDAEENIKDGENYEPQEILVENQNPESD